MPNVTRLVGEEVPHQTHHNWDSQINGWQTTHSNITPQKK